MIIQKDKIEHFAFGLIIFSIVTKLVGFLMAGLVAAVATEFAKIVFYDMPRNQQMDWREKAFDMLAQILGALTGALIFISIG